MKVRKSRMGHAQLHFPPLSYLLDSTSSSSKTEPNYGLWMQSPAEELGTEKVNTPISMQVPTAWWDLGQCTPLKNKEFCALRKSWSIRINAAKEILSREVTETICPPSNLNLDSTVTSGGQRQGAVKVFNLIQMHLNCSRTDTDDK